ncbi:MAG: hypothetical protein ACK5P7_09185 [Bdellovibrio sp.]
MSSNRNLFLNQKVHSKERGAALVYVLVLAGIFVGVGVTLAYGFVTNARNQKMSRLRTVSSQIVGNIEAALLNDASLKATIDGNASLSCLRATGGDCSSATKGEIAVLLADASVLSSLSPSFGYNLLGQPCNAYSESSPDASCVFRTTVSWDCDGVCELTNIPSAGGPLAKPTKPALKFRIQIRQSSKPSLMMPFLNTDKLAVDFLRRDALDSLESGCFKMGGHLNAEGRCSLSQSIARCGRWEFLSRYDENGEIECQAMPAWNTRCPPGNAAVGINTRGEFECFMY